MAIPAATEMLRAVLQRAVLARATCCIFRAVLHAPGPRAEFPVPCSQGLSLIHI